MTHQSKTTKTLLLSILRNVAMGAIFGYLFSYLPALNATLPTTIQQYAQNQGIAGATSGIIGGFCGVAIPHILIPQLKRIPLIKRVFDYVSTSFKG